MLKFDFTNDELDYIKSKIHFTPRQIRIIRYRRDELSLLEMAELEHCDVSTISRELRKIKHKIMRVI
jgi:DNA-binding CsgD family transcriptional regulator